MESFFLKGYCANSKDFLLKMEKKKVALVTIYHVPNYGSVLQAFATQCVIEGFGYECVVLDYRYPNEWHIKQDPRRKGSLKSKIATFLGLKSSHRKNRKLQKFRKKYFHFSKEYINLDALKNEDWSGYDVFVSGSDQLWNSRFTLADSVFMLSFVPNSKRRISLASSFSSDNIPTAYREKYLTYLSKFNSLSVREKNGKCIIEDDLKIKQCKVLLDPTLLMSKKEWLNRFPYKEEQKEKYILLYLLTYAFESRPYVFEVVRYFSKKYGYKVIALEGYTSPEKALGLKMEDRTDAGIENYMSLFAHAQMVITTSFHGTAFAVNFGIPLVSITSGGGDDRQSSLLALLGMEQCITPVGYEIAKIAPFYNVENTLCKLEGLRNDSLSWIMNSLSGLL